MPTNYFGRPNMKYILYAFLSGRTQLSDNIRKRCAVLNDTKVIRYQSYRGKESLEVTAYEEDETEHRFWLTANGYERKQVMLSEEVFRPGQREVFYYGAEYDYKFCWVSGEIKLKCDAVKKGGIK